MLYLKTDFVLLNSIFHYNDLAKNLWLDLGFTYKNDIGPQLHGPAS